LSGTGERLPYPGLRAFNRDEADLFFGRDKAVNDLIRRLSDTRFLAVLGASGTGKSSLVRTGMLDGLELGLHPAGANWLFCDIAPGGQPIRSLARGLLQVAAEENGTDDVTPDDIETLEWFLRRGPRSLIEWLDEGHVPDDVQLLILVDQFEELFRFSNYEGREVAEAFVKLLIHASREEGSRLHIVITMRSEYLGACVLIPELADTINSGSYLTPRMDRDSCRKAIEGPARMYGTDIEPALVTRLLNDLDRFAPFDEEIGEDQLRTLSRRSDQLPVMQHVLNRVWQAEAADGVPGPLRLESYEGFGGINGALNRHGEEVLASLSGVDKTGPEKVFRALVDGATVASSGRRALPFSKLVREVGLPEAEVRQIVEMFRRPDVNFLRPPPEEPLGPDTIIDISHESLIRQWSLLSDWLLNEARGAAVIRRVAESQSRYASGEGELLSGLDLANIRSWWDTDQPSPEWAARYVDNFDALESYLHKARETEDELAAKRQRRQRRERHRLWAFSAVTSVIAIVAGLFFLDAREKSEEAQRMGAQAQSSEEDMLAATESLAIDLVERLEKDRSIPLQAKYGLIQNTEAAFRTITANRATDPNFVDKRADFLLASVVALSRGGFWHEAEDYAYRLEKLVTQPPSQWTPSLDFELRSAVALAEMHRMGARRDHAVRWLAIAEEKLALVDSEAPEYFSQAALVHRQDARVALQWFQYERQLQAADTAYQRFRAQRSMLESNIGQRMRAQQPERFKSAENTLVEYASTVIEMQRGAGQAIVQIDAHRRFDIDFNQLVQNTEDVLGFMRGVPDVAGQALSEAQVLLHLLKAQGLNQNDPSVPGAVDEIDNAVRLLEDLSAQDPSNRLHRVYLMQALMLRGDYSKDSGQFGQATADLDAAEELLVDLRARGMAWTDRVQWEPWIYFRRWELARAQSKTGFRSHWERDRMVQSIKSIRSEPNVDQSLVAFTGVAHAYADLTMHFDGHLDFDEVTDTVESSLAAMPTEEENGSEPYFWLMQRQYIYRQLLFIGPEKLGQEAWQEAFENAIAEVERLLEIAPGAYRPTYNLISHHWNAAADQVDDGDELAALDSYRLAFDAAFDGSKLKDLRDDELDTLLSDSVKLLRNLVINGDIGFAEDDLVRTVTFLDYHLTRKESFRSILEAKAQFDALENELVGLADKWKPSAQVSQNGLAQRLRELAPTIGERLAEIQLLEIDKTSDESATTADIEEVRAQIRELNIDKNLLDDGLVYWVRPPLMAAVWQTLEGDVFDDMKSLLEQAISSGEVSYIRVAELSFYKKAELVEAQVGAGPRARIFAFIVDGKRNIFRLNGTSPLIHEMNAKAPISLETRNQVAAYIRFFTHYVNGPEGSFSIVESTSEIPFAETADTSEHERAQKVLRPFVVWKHPDTPGRWQAAATVYYGRSLFHAIFEVQPNGMIEMLNDKPIVSNLEASLIRVSDRENGVRLGGESVGRSISFDRLDLKRHETDPDRIATVIARSSDLPEEDASRFRRDFVLPVLGEAFVKQYSNHGRDRNAIAYDLLVADVELDLALSLARLAVEKEPGNPYYADTLGWALLKSGMTEEAIVELERARDGDPNQAEIRAHLAQAYRISGRIEDARAAVNTALSMTVSAFWKEFLQEELRLINAANE